MLTSFVYGLLLGAGLIIAIGAQNAFVLRLGLLRSHVFVICLICALSDALLISLGVLGFGSLVQKSDTALFVVRYAGAAFLVFYGLQAFWRALKPDSLRQSETKVMGLRTATFTCLALTFLNPHVYLDTVVVLGGVSSKYTGLEQLAFGLGAVVASFVWFFSLGYGARLLTPIFQKPRSWQILDLLIALLMWMIAFSLVIG